LELLVLASGSSGNAALVSSGRTSILVDAGVSALQIRRRLEALGRLLEDVDAVVVTHEHSDHVRGLEVLLKRRPMPVWTTAGTWSCLSVKSPSGGEIVSGTRLEIGGLRVLPVATSHDAAEPVALVVEDGHHRLSWCTDTGIVTELLARRMAGAHLMCIESNHDADMLRQGPYPWPLKQRIASRVGHLGNHQTAEAMDRLMSPDLKAVVGLHLSAENNCPALVHHALGHALAERCPVKAVNRATMLRVKLDGDEPTVESYSVPPTNRRRGAIGGP